MRKVVAFLGASFCLAWVAPARAQAPDMFQDVPTDHWAYQAVENLRAKGIVIGYPDGLYRGKRTMTRYEFAVAIDRALKTIEAIKGPPGEPGPRGEQGPAGPAGPAGPPGVAPEELQTLRRLINEFREELARLGNDINAINRRLDQLTRDVEDIKKRLDKMPVIYGGAGVFVRSDRAGGTYVDRDGRVFGLGGAPTGTDFVSSPIAVHQFVLGVKAKLPGDATVDAALTSNNYANYLGGNTAVITPLNANPAADTYIHHLEVSAPFSGLGRGSNLTFGRYGHKVSRYTFWKPDVDTYFHNPFEDNGMFYIDGVKFHGHFGSVLLTAFAGQTKTVTGTNPPLDAAGFPAGWNKPLAGVSLAAGPVLFAGGQKPIGQPALGQMLVDQLAGVSLGVAIREILGTKGGHISVHAIDTSNTRGGLTAPGGFTNVAILGADIDLKIADRLSFQGDYAKTLTGTSRLNVGSSAQNRQNNAFSAMLGYASGGLDVKAGYRYIDPLFYAPGYWARIGNWLNPTNVQGPTFRAAYDFSPSFGLEVGGDFYSGARNRAAVGGLSINDDITRLLANVRWDLSKALTTSIGWEGVFYSFSAGSAFSNAARVHPTEHYLTLGAGYNITGNTILKLSYQIGEFDGHGLLGGGVPGLGRYSFNTFTSQVAVKF